MRRLFFAALIFFLVGGIIFGYTKSYFATKQRKITSPNASCAVTIVSPQAGSVITNPLSVNLIIDNTKPGCHWTVFEAQAGIAQLVDSTGLLLGQAQLKTTEDWTLSKPTAYNAIIPLNKQPTTSIVNLILEEENPSGKPNPQKITMSLSTK